MNAQPVSDEVTAKARAFTLRPRELLIGGRWRPAAAGAAFEVIDPATGHAFARASAGDAAGIDAAVASLARMANDTEYDLAASIWPRDISVAHRLARRITAGSVRINTPGTVDSALPRGGYKQSGWGRESGRDGTEICTEIKSVTVGL